MRLILYSKPGCHLCEGLQEKLEQIQSLNFELEIRDITTREDWFRAYQYEVPVLCECKFYDHPYRQSVEEKLPPSLTPRHCATAEQMLQKYLAENEKE